MPKKQNKNEKQQQQNPQQQQRTNKNKQKHDSRNLETRENLRKRPEARNENHLTYLRSNNDENYTQLQWTSCQKPHKREEVGVK